MVRMLPWQWEEGCLGNKSLLDVMDLLAGRWHRISEQTQGDSPGIKWLAGAMAGGGATATMQDPSHLAPIDGLAPSATTRAHHLC